MSSTAARPAMRSYDMWCGIPGLDCESRTSSFRHTGDDFIAFLGATDGETAEAVADRIRNRISQHPVVLSSGASLSVEASVTAVASPRDGLSLKDLLSVARQRGASQASPYGGPSIH